MALVSAIAALLLLPLTSFGLLRPGVSIGGGTVAQVIQAVPRVTSAVNSTVDSTVQQVQKVLAPAASAVTSVTSPGSAPASVAAAPQRAGAATNAVTGTPSTPPMYGTNPNGQGTVAAAWLPPSTVLPYPYVASEGGSKSSGDALVLGRGRSEQQSDGTYDAHTTIAALLGMELLGVNATEGQSNTGPLNALQTGVLDNICKSSSEQVCLTVLAADTSATTTGASTHFAITQANIGGATGVKAGVASADSQLQTTGTCQTASGSSQAANLTLAGGQVLGVGKASESSTACAGQTPTQTASSSVVDLGGTGVGLPAAGCANGTPNTKFGLLSPLVTILCNADDTTQLATPDGVREALTVIVLQTAQSALLKTSAVAAQSHAVAPLAKKGGGHKGGGGNNGGGKTRGKTVKCKDADHDCGHGPGGGTAACANDTFDHDGDCDNGEGVEGNGSIAHLAAGNLPFTGENVLEVIFTGLALTAMGIVLSSRGRKRNQKR
jgi:hypothetical protein